MLQLDYKVLAGRQDISDALEIRREVFIEEQNVPEAREVDGLDEEANHYIYYEAGKAVGTARVRYIEGAAKIERVATLKSYRGKELGRALMNFILADLKRLGVRKVVLESQTYIEGFYKSLGFSRVGEEFEDAGMPHIKMVKELKA
jgi:predicted GNAT family N-acyltransferase